MRRGTNVRGCSCRDSSLAVSGMLAVRNVSNPLGPNRVAPPPPPFLAKVVIRRRLFKGDFEAVLQIKGLGIKVFKNKGLTDGFWGVCIIPGANSLLSVGYVTVLLTCRAVSSPVPKCEDRGHPSGVCTRWVQARFHCARGTP